MNPIERYPLKNEIALSELNKLLYPLKLERHHIEDNFGFSTIDGSIGMYSVEDAIEIVNDISDICYNALEALSNHQPSTTGSPYELD